MMELFIREILQTVKEMADSRELVEVEVLILRNMNMGKKSLNALFFNKIILLRFLRV